MRTNLPILCIALQHHHVLGLANIAVVVLLNLLGPLLCLYPVILGEGTLVAGAAGMGKEVRPDGLDRPLRSMVLRDLSKRLEVFFSRPSLRKGRQG